MKKTSFNILPVVIMAAALVMILVAASAIYAGTMWYVDYKTQQFDDLLEVLSEYTEDNISYDEFEYSLTQNKTVIRNLGFRLFDSNHSFDEIVISDIQFRTVASKDYLGNIHIITTNTRSYNETIDSLTKVIAAVLTGLSDEDNPPVSLEGEFANNSYIDILLLGRTLFAREEKDTMEELRNPVALQKNLGLFFRNEQESLHPRKNTIHYQHNVAEKTIDFSFDNEVSQIGNSHFSIVLENFSLSAEADSLLSDDVLIKEVRLAYIDEGFAARMYYWILGIIDIPQEKVVEFINTYLENSEEKGLAAGDAEKEQNRFFASLLQQLQLLMAGEKDGLQILLEPPEALSYKEAVLITESVESYSDKEQIVAAINRLGLQITAVDTIP